MTDTDAATGAIEHGQHDDSPTMTEITTTLVGVFEENKTRAELYRLWLDSCEVQIAQTKRQADKIIEHELGVAVIDESFADEAVSNVVELVQSRAPACRLLATRPRSSAFPGLDADEQLVKPVFEDELVETVKRLLHQANYHLALTMYYQTVITLAPLEFDDSDTDDDRYRQLTERADELRVVLAGLREDMTDDDVAAVIHSLTGPKNVEIVDSAEEVDSKYQPEVCSNCGVEWTDTGDGGPSVVQLAAHIWRCSGCGHVQMYTHASHRHVNPS